MPSAQTLPADCNLEECLHLLDADDCGTFVPPHGPQPFPHFRLIPLTPRRGWPIALCEASVGRRLPAYGERLRWREEVPDFRSGILIFVDPAHAHFVWTWRLESSGWGGQYVEYQLPHRQGSLTSALLSLPSFGARAAALPATPDPVILERSLRLIRSADLRSADGREAGPLLREWIERIALPGELRRAWRSLRQFRVLVLRASPSRVLEAAASLELLYLAMLGRIRSLVDDSAAGRERRRPEHLRDLRGIIEEAEHPRWGSDATRFVRRLIVQQHIFAVASSRTGAAACIRTLLDYARCREDCLPLVDCNVSVGSAPGTAVPEESGGGDPLGEEVELLGRAWAFVRRIRMEGAEIPELQRAESQIESRRRLLRRQLEAMEPGRSIAPFGQLDLGPGARPGAFSATLG